MIMTTGYQPSAEGAGPGKQGQFDEAVKQCNLRRRTLFRPGAALAETGGITRVAYERHPDLWPLFLAVGGVAYPRCVRVTRETGAADK
jgi:hypothetical protein